MNYKGRIVDSTDVAYKLTKEEQEFNRKEDLKERERRNNELEKERETNRIKFRMRDIMVKMFELKKEGNLLEDFNAKFQLEEEILDLKGKKERVVRLASLKELAPEMKEILLKDNKNKLEEDNERIAFKIKEYKKILKNIKNNKHYDKLLELESILEAYSELSGLKLWEYGGTGKSTYYGHHNWSGFENWKSKTNGSVKPLGSNWIIKNK